MLKIKQIGLLLMGWLLLKLSTMSRVLVLSCGRGRPRNALSWQLSFAGCCFTFQALIKDPDRCCPPYPPSLKHWTAALACRGSSLQA